MSQRPFNDHSAYKVGGNLDAHHPTYVRRSADNEILAALSNGECCYVFNARQMGKTSGSACEVMMLA